MTTGRINQDVTSFTKAELCCNSTQPQLPTWRGLKHSQQMLAHNLFAFMDLIPFKLWFQTQPISQSSLNILPPVHAAMA